ncbi:MAG: L-threonylcarbamoyladenylate synthase [Treponema sp.]|nr:L-threonylcarbamoyladenylate synthase [Treponema sp.]
MEFLSTSEVDIQKAAAALASGLLVAFPTETVYGLGADAFNVTALARVFQAKNRPRFDPLIIHIAEYAALSRIADIDSLNGESAERLSILSKHLWPGPLTLILPKRPALPDLATSGLPTAAVRFPSHPVAQKLIRYSTGAVAAPSANPFGYLSPTQAEHVKAQLGSRVDVIIDGGRATVGVESTVLDLSSGGRPRLLRPGGTPRERIEELIGAVEFSCGTSAGAAGAQETPVSPGQLKSHYAPRTPLVLCRRGELASLPDISGEGRLYFAPPAGKSQVLGGTTRVLSVNGDTTEAAANLFQMLHELDALELTRIRAEEAPTSGLGAAINDRLQRAEYACGNTCENAYENTRLP